VTYLRSPYNDNMGVTVDAAVLMRHPTTGKEQLYALFPVWEYAQHVADECNSWDTDHGIVYDPPRFRVEDAGWALSKVLTSV